MIVAELLSRLGRMLSLEATKSHRRVPFVLSFAVAAALAVSACDRGGGSSSDLGNSGQAINLCAACNDGNPCTTDTCTNPATGACTHTPATGPCDDGNACTTNDQCSGGRCVGGPTLVCNDNNPCTNESCNKTTGCAYAFNTAGCNDGNSCTTNDKCTNGTCAGTPKNCDDGNPCTSDSCNPTTGACVHVNNTDPCSDGNACTTNDTCSGGTCHGGTLLNCNDNNPCTNDSCSAVSGCAHTNNNTAPCSDGSACTSGDHCAAGVCTGTPKSCDDGNACTSDTCDAATGACSHPTAPNGTSCDDGNLCTQVDSCQAGACVGASPVVCGAGSDGCHPNVCDPSNGTCSAVSACTLYGCGSIPGTALDGLNVSPAMLEDGTPNNRIGGFGSAIAYTGTGNLYVATPDRGPADGATSYTDRYYLFDISLAGGVVTPVLVGAATLNQSPGVPFVGHNTEFDATNSPASRRFDPEGIRVSPSDTFYVSDEYGPFVYEFDPDGNRIRSLNVPSKFLIAHPAIEDAELPPANTSGRQVNRGMEGLALSPDGGKLYGLMQNALIQDGALDASNKRIGLNNRLLEIDTGTGATRELLYQLTNKSYGTNEILAVNDHQFLALERDGNAGTAAAFKRLFLIDINGATDISGVAALPTSGTPAGVTPVAKSPFLDLLLAEYGLAGPTFPEKIEGIAFGPDLPDGRHVLIVTNDNDFVPTQESRFCAFAIDPVALPGFEAPQATLDNQCEEVSCPAPSACYLQGDCNPGTGSCSNAPVAAGTAVGSQTAGDCQSQQCDGAGHIVSAIDNSDLPVDGNACTSDLCTNGVPSNPPLPAGTPCAGGLCNSAGTCVECNTASDCPGADDECGSRVCSAAGICLVDYAPAGTRVSDPVAGDCSSLECDGAGQMVAASDDADVPVDGNPCTSDLCTDGVPSNPPATQGTACGANQVCDGSGVCVGCFSASDCPGSDTECGVRVCNAGACGFNYAASGTPVALQTNGDCLANVCDGAGGVTQVSSPSDVPVDDNQCTADLCSGGLPSNPNQAYLTSCNQNGGTICDGAGSCVPLTFSVLRVGQGSSALSSAAAALFVEKIKTDGTNLGTVALPTAASGNNQAISESGSASSEGQLSLSQDGHYLVVPGYAAAPGTSGVASTATSATRRVIGRIDAVGVSDTSTLLTTAFDQNNFRGATSFDGTTFWAAGAGGSSGGIWAIALGVSGGTQVSSSNTRWLGVFNNQLYGTSNQSNLSNVYTVGSGLPTTSATLTALPGMPSGTGPSPFGFVFFDRNASPPGLDTLYVADDRATASGGGIQKWTYNGTTWTLAATFNTVSSGSPTGFRGVGGVLTPDGNVTLVASTTEASANRLVVYVDTGSGTPSGTVIGTAPTNTVYRGVAPSPH